MPSLDSSRVTLAAASANTEGNSPPTEPTSESPTPQASSPTPQARSKKRSALPLDPDSFVSDATPDQRHYIQAFEAPPPPIQLEIPLDAISPNPSQPRQVFDPESLRALASSIAEVGILEPIVVRASLVDGPPTGDQQYQIVIGERRWRAAREAGLTELPCIVRQLSDDQAFLVALSENIQRDDLTALEEAEAYHHLIQSGAVANQAELARRLGVTRARISQKMKLVHLDHHSKQLVLQHPRQITEHHAQQLLRIPSLELRHRAADLILETGISARSLQRRLRQLSSPLFSPDSEIHQVSHRGFSLRIALDAVDRERAVGDLAEAIRRLQAAPPPPEDSPSPGIPLPGLD